MANHSRIDGYIEKLFEDSDPNQMHLVGMYRQPYIIENAQYTQKKYPGGLYSVKVNSGLQEAHEVNRNVRRYGKEILAPALEHPFIKENQRNRSWYGEANHPLSKNPERLMRVDQLRAFGSIDKTWWEGNQVRGSIESMLDTEAGKAYAGAVIQKRRTGYSMRGFGPSKITYESVGGQQRKIMDITKLFIVCYDWVQYPSHTKSYQDDYFETVGLSENTVGIAESIDDLINHMSGDEITENSEYGVFPFAVDSPETGFDKLVESMGDHSRVTNALHELGINVDEIVGITPSGNIAVQDNDLCEGGTVHSVVISPTEYFRNNVLGEMFTGMGFGAGSKRQEAFQAALDRVDSIIHRKGSKVDKIRRIRSLINNCANRTEAVCMQNHLHRLESSVQDSDVRQWLKSFGRIETSRQLRKYC